MRIVDDQVVYANRYPTSRAEQYSGTTVCVSRAGSAEPYLLAAFRVGQARMSVDGRIGLAVSRDWGRTWQREAGPLEGTIDWPASDALGLLPGVAGTASLAGAQMGADADGTTLLTAARMWLAEPGGAGWSDEAAGLLDADSVVARAPAGGPWETPVPIDGRRHADEWAIPCGPPVALGGGRWMFPMERHAKTHVREWLRGYHAFAGLSADDGRTWPELVPMMNDPERRVAHYDQRCCLRADGTIVSLAWAHDVIDDVTLPARVGFSDDGGRTWSAPAETGIMAGPVNPVTLPDGRIFAAYARRTAPTGVRCCLSEDGGRTWRTDRELVLFDEASGRVIGEPASVVDRVEADPSLWNTMWGWTFGQPMPVALPDGHVGVVFFAQGPDRVPAIRFLRLDPADG